MSYIVMGTLLQSIVGIVLFLLALFLIMLVLVQRGRGGGLSGAFGGAGGQSAFGTRAGDTFTRITIVAASIWIVSCAVAVKYLGTEENPLSGGGLPGPDQVISGDESAGMGAGSGDSPVDVTADDIFGSEPDASETPGNNTEASPSGAEDPPANATSEGSPADDS